MVMTTLIFFNTPPILFVNRFEKVKEFEFDYENKKIFLISFCFIKVHFLQRKEIKAFSQLTEQPSTKINDLLKQVYILNF